MKNNSTLTGHAPVTTDVMSASRSAALAEKLSSRNYNWDCLAEFLIDFTPEDASETLKLVYFEYSRLVLLNPDEVASNANNLLFLLQRMCEVFHKMATTRGGALALVPISDHVVSKS